MLRDIILYLLQRAGWRGLSKTRLMKLLFLVDAYAVEELGRPVTGVEWRRWYFGPFSKEVLEELEELEYEGLVVEERGEGYTVYLLDPSVAVEPRLPERIRGIVDRVLGEWGRLPLDELLAKLYERYGIRSYSLGERITWRR